MRIIHRLSLLAILALPFVFTEPALVAGQGWYGYNYNSPYYCPPSQADIEQYMWDMQTYYFLNDYDPYGGPAYNQLPYSTPAYNIPTYRAVPTYTAAYSTPSSYNAPGNNQSVINGNATYWFNEANVFYLTGSYEQAAEAYAKAVNLDPSLSEGWLNLGNSLYFLGKYQASLNAYGTLLKLEPENADASAGKNQALLALNNTLGPNNSTMIPSTVQ
jgi:tetratricopeptide (TPR) repeat protein